MVPIHSFGKVVGRGSRIQDLSWRFGDEWYNQCGHAILYRHTMIVSTMTLGHLYSEQLLKLFPDELNPEKLQNIPGATRKFFLRFPMHSHHRICTFWPLLGYPVFWVFCHNLSNWQSKHLACINPFWGMTFISTLGMMWEHVHPRLHITQSTLLIKQRWCICGCTYVQNQCSWPLPEIWPHWFYDTDENLFSLGLRASFAAHSSTALLETIVCALHLHAFNTDNGLVPAALGHQGH